MQALRLCSNKILQLDPCYLYNDCKLIISTKWTEWNWQRSSDAFVSFSPSVYRLWRHCCMASVNAWCICFNINIFDTCVKSCSRIFPFGQYIVGNVTFLAFWRHSRVQKIETGVDEKCTKMYTVSVRCFGFVAHSSKLLRKRGYNVIGGIAYFRQKCIRLVCEKLRIFPYGRYVVGKVVILAFWRYSQVQVWSGGWGKCRKMLTPFPIDFRHAPQHAVIINDVIIVGTRLLHTYITREARM